MLGNYCKFCEKSKQKHLYDYRNRVNPASIYMIWVWDEIKFVKNKTMLIQAQIQEFFPGGVQPPIYFQRGSKVEFQTISMLKRRLALYFEKFQGGSGPPVSTPVSALVIITIIKQLKRIEKLSQIYAPEETWTYNVREWPVDDCSEHWQLRVSNIYMPS